MSQPIAVVVTLAAATAFALSSVAEQRSTKQVPRRGVLAPRLLLDLLSRPLWLAAIALNAVGSVLQIVALHFGALALVQPLLVSNLVLAVVFAVVLRHRKPDVIIFAGVVACAAGIAGFLAVGRPSGGRQTVSFVAVLPLAILLAGVLLSPVLAVITTTDPLVSIAIAHVWLKEDLSSSPAAVAGEVVSLAIMVAGIIALSRRAPHVAPRLAEEGA